MTIDAYLEDTKETLQTFAKRSGVSLATLKRIKQTGSARRADTIEKIDRATNGLVSASDLLKLSGDCEGVH